MGKQWQTLFLGAPKFTADGDCSHEIKRRSLLAGKVMTNLDSILKSRDFTLPTKVHLVKAMVFPVVMYGCAPSAPHQSRKVRSQGGGVSVSPSLSEGRSYSVYQRRDTQQFCRLRDDKTISGNTPQIRGFQKNSFLINYAEVSLCCFPPCRRMFSTLPKATT